MPDRRFQHPDGLVAPLTVGRVQGRIVHGNVALRSGQSSRQRRMTSARGKTTRALAANTPLSVSRRGRRVSGSDKPQTNRFGPLLTLGYIDRNALPFGQAHNAGALQRRGVHEYILAALIRRDKAETLIGVVPLH